MNQSTDIIHVNPSDITKITGREVKPILNMHTQKCKQCHKVKRTGLSINQNKEWLDHQGRRSAIERSIKTLTSNHDFGLLRDKACFNCVNNVVEEVVMTNDYVEFI